MPFEGVHHVKGRDRRAVAVICVGDCVADDVLEKCPEDTASLLIDEAEPSLGKTVIATRPVGVACLARKDCARLYKGHVGTRRPGDAEDRGTRHSLCVCNLWFLSMCYRRRICQQVRNSACGGNRAIRIDRHPVRPYRAGRCDGPCNWDPY